MLQWRDLWEGIHGREGEEAKNVKKEVAGLEVEQERGGCAGRRSKGVRGMWAGWMGLGLPMADLASMPLPIPIFFFQVLHSPLL